MAALAFATFAFAAHLHEIDAAKGHLPDQVCGLCVHVDRFGTTPDAALLPVLAPVVAAVPTDLALPAPPQPALPAYRSRAPPA